MWLATIWIGPSIALASAVTRIGSPPSFGRASTCTAVTRTGPSSIDTGRVIDSPASPPK